MGRGLVDADGDDSVAGSRTATTGTLKPKWRRWFNGGWEQNTGRWPANVIHDGSDEVVALFPDKANQQVGIGKKLKWQCDKCSCW
jgi:hypothetical protein